MRVRVRLVSDIRDYFSVSRFHRVSTRRIETLVMSVERFALDGSATEYPVLSLQFFCFRAVRKVIVLRDIISVTV